MPSAHRRLLELAAAVLCLCLVEPPVTGSGLPTRALPRRAPAAGAYLSGTHLVSAIVFIGHFATSCASPQAPPSPRGMRALRKRAHTNPHDSHDVAILFFA